MTTARPDVSVIVTVDERPEPLVPLFEEYARALRDAGMVPEFIFVAQPEHRELADALTPLALKGEPVRVFLAAQHLSEAALLKVGARNAAADTVVTMPAYRRVEAAGLPAMVRRLREGAEVVVARRWPRTDAWVNRLQNRAFHALVSAPARSVRLSDIASGVRAMHVHVLREMTLYGDFARFMPVLAQRDGYDVVELDVPQHQGDRKARVYGLSVYPLRLVDVLGLFFLTRFNEKPLRFFGLVGGAISFAGGVLLLILLIQRLGGHGISNRPLLLLAVLLFVMGVQAIALGLIGEIIVHLGVSRQRNYRLAGSGDRAES